MKQNIEVGYIENKNDGMWKFLNSRLLGCHPVRVKLTSSDKTTRLIVYENQITIEGKENEGIQILFNSIFIINHKTMIKEGEYQLNFRYSYRSFLLDEARHFYGIDEVKKILDIMFIGGYNLFHFHLSDDQGFRIKLDSHPELMAGTKRSYTMRGWAHGITEKIDQEVSGFYTSDEIREIIEYARVRGIEVIPEIDMPGHMSALLVAHPEFTCSGKTYEVPGYFGVLEHNLCLGDSEAVNYIFGIIDEFIELFHPHKFCIGFDEIKTDTMHQCKKCQKKIIDLGLRNEIDLIGSFQNDIVKYLLGRGITPIIYDDGLQTSPDGIIVQCWKGKKEKVQRSIINRGYHAIMSPYYSMYASNPYALTPLWKTFFYNPIKGIKKKENVLGIELCYWSEYSNSHERLVFELYYRMMAASSVFQGKNHFFISFLNKLKNREEIVFGEKESIPFGILCPPFIVRLQRMLKYIKNDIDIEERLYRRKHGN